MVVGRDGLNPRHMCWWSGANIHRLTGHQQAPSLQKPLSECFRTGIAPPPRRGQFRHDREMRAHLLLPVGQGVTTETEDALHRIAKHAGRQNQREKVDEIVLRHRTVLILINDKVRIGRFQDLADVSGLQQLPCEFADRRVVSRWRGKPQDVRVVTAATRKARNQPNGPAVDGAQSIGTVRHTGTVQPATKCRHASIRVREHEDGFATSVSGQGVGDQLCLAAPGRCRNRAAGNRAQVDFSGAHEQPTQIPGPPAP